MSKPRVEFAWDVAESGYQWLEGLPLLPGAPAGLYLTERPPGKAGRRVRRYEPLREHTGLFRTFADTETTPEGILQFADAYGLLGIQDTVESFNSATEANGLTVSKGPARRFVGEKLFSWKNEITRLRGAVLLWDLLSANDEERLKAHIVWEGHDRVRFDDHSALMEDHHWADALVIASREERNPELLASLVPGDVVQPAWVYLLERVNMFLETQTSPVLGRSDDGKVRLENRPRSLLGALWVQFAKALEGEKRFRQCTECDNWFEVSNSVSRSDKMYCSNACRVRAYQKRKARARVLHDEGLSMVEIAKRLETDPTTVRGWVKNMEGKTQ